MDKIYYQHMPVIEDQTRAGQPPFLANWPMPYACTPPIDLLDFPIMRYTMDAAFEALDQWVSKGIPAPHADRIAVTDGGTPKAAFVTDRFGNTAGGVRSVYLELNAKLQTQAIALGGTITYLDAQEARRVMAAGENGGYQRAWDLWKRKAGGKTQELQRKQPTRTSLSLPSALTRAHSAATLGRNSNGERRLYERHQVPGRLPVPTNRRKAEALQCPRPGHLRPRACRGLRLIAAACPAARR